MAAAHISCAPSANDELLCPSNAERLRQCELERASSTSREGCDDCFFERGDPLGEPSVGGPLVFAARGFVVDETCDGDNCVARAVVRVRLENGRGSAGVVAPGLLNPNRIGLTGVGADEVWRVLESPAPVVDEGCDGSPELILEACALTTAEECGVVGVGVQLMDDAGELSNTSCALLSFAPGVGIECGV